ncbi:FGGY family carbohydrate kinase [Treponema sp.]|uniref:FGGY family carbohydrate kinase n=1 Tax=Treponema sp. TaxID=166 RepID=UPI00388E2E72
MTILCVDIGTSSLKAALITDEGKVLAKSRRKFLLVKTEHSSKEWFPALQNATTELFEQAPESKVDGICISGNGPTLVATSGETFLWNEEAVQIKSPSLFIPRIISFKNKYSGVWEKTQYIFGAPEYLIWLLTDKACTILPEERYRKAYWTDEDLAAAGLTSDDIAKLPPFKMSSEKIGGLTHKAVSFIGGEEHGIEDGLPVFLGAPDFVAALVGTATVEENTICDRAGSSEGINFCTKEPLYGEGIRTLPSIIPGLWNASVLLPDSGSKFAAFKQKIDRELGESVDYNDLLDRMIDSDGTSAALDQGKYLLIQTALDVKSAIETLRKAAFEKGLPFPDKMTITGGQASNDKRNQMKADITGIKIQVPSCSDSELLGDAAMALAGMGVFGSIQEASKKLFSAGKLFVPSVEE